MPPQQEVPGKQQQGAGHRDNVEVGEVGGLDCRREQVHRGKCQRGTTMVEPAVRDPIGRQRTERQYRREQHDQRLRPGVDQIERCQRQEKQLDVECQQRVRVRALPEGQWATLLVADGAAKDREAEEVAVQVIPGDLIGVAHVEGLALQVPVPIERQPARSHRVEGDEYEEQQARSIGCERAALTLRRGGTWRGRGRPNVVTGAVNRRAGRGRHFTALSGRLRRRSRGRARNRSRPIGTEHRRRPPATRS